MAGLHRLLIAVLFSLAALPAAAVELVMVQQAGCTYCQRWNEEIAPAYPNTGEGRFAPLRRVDIGAVQDEISVVRRVSFTPTFLIVEDGREIARLEGYPGENFFWPVLSNLLLDNTDFKGDDGS